MLPDPTKPPTPQEFAVIALLLSGSLIILGIAGYVFAFLAPPEKHGLALQMEHYSGIPLAGGILIAVVAWLVRRFTE